MSPIKFRLLGDILKERDAIRSTPRSWRVGEVVEKDGCYYLHGGEERDTLPVEFFNHELRALETHDDKAVKAFVSEWGLPYSPLRSNGGLIPAFDFLGDDGISDTNTINKKRWQGGGFDGQLETACISMKEARFTLAKIQKAVERLIYGLDTETSLDLAALYINSGAGSAISLSVYPDAANQIFSGATGTATTLTLGTLTGAICNQILEAFADTETLWRRCECDTPRRKCDRRFKRQRRYNAKGYYEPNVSSVYCSDRCRETMSKARKRLSAQNRIDHGLS